MSAAEHARNFSREPSGTGPVRPGPQGYEDMR